jgi:GNAT superfamily N-acetyltransferase
MSEHSYPDDPVGPFPEPPLSFEDREGRAVDLRGYEPGAEVPEPLVEMYDAFDPADRAQGIPPSGDDHVRRWLAELFESGFNVVAWHGETAAGHATLVPASEDPDGGDGGQPEGAGGKVPHELAIFVLQAYQEAGIGKRLLRALLGYGSAQGVDRVWLTVEQWNRSAIGLYEDVGFETVGSRSFEVEMSVRVA